MVGLALTVAMTAAGRAWRDCLRLAGSVALAFRLFLLRTDRGAPWSPLVAGLTALTDGVMAGAAGVASIAAIGAVGPGWGQPQAPNGCGRCTSMKTP